jgi:hypothetical protein
MLEVPYTTVPGTLKKLLNKIRIIGKPKKATYNWLTSIGFASSNARTTIGVLRYIDLLDESGAPTERWSNYRGADHKQVLGKAIKDAYVELYSTYPNAHDIDKTELEHYFSTKSNAGKQTIGKMAATFKALCSEADFITAPLSGYDEVGKKPVAADLPAHEVVAGKMSALGSGVTVNINVQLTLPATTDETVYDKLFSAMKKHLIRGNDE